MSLENLFPPAMLENEFWYKLIDSVDAFQKANVYDQLLIMRSLRDARTFDDPTLIPNIDYIEETVKREFSPGYYRVDKVSFSAGSNYVLYEESDLVDPNTNLPQLRRLFVGIDYTVQDAATFSLLFNLPNGHTIRAIQHKHDQSDVQDVFTYGVQPVVAYFELPTPSASVTLNVYDSINTETGVPAELSSGYPYNLLIVYYWSPVANDYRYLPYGNVTAEPDGKTLKMQVPESTTKFKIFSRVPSTELTRKLRELSFLYPDLEFVTRPTYVENSHILQLMSDNYGKFLRESQGTKSFMDFYQFCSNTMIDIKLLWAQDQPGSIDNPVTDDKSYGKFVREEDLDLTLNPPIYETGPDNGGWYPTSHVDLVYDLMLFGSNIDFKAIQSFFNYVAPINLVLYRIVLELTPPVTENVTLYVDGAGDFVQYF